MKKGVSGVCRVSFRAVLLLVGVLVGPLANACDLSRLQVQDEALAALRERFPNQTFTRGSNADVVKMGEVELGLQNLRARLCLAGGDKARRRADITEFLDATLKLTVDQTNKLPETWAGAESKVRLQLMNTDYLRPFAGKKVLVTKSLIPDVEIAVVVGAGVILTHVVGVNLTHLSNDDGLLAINNVDSGASSGDQGNGAPGRQHSRDGQATRVFTQYREAIFA